MCQDAITLVDEQQVSYFGKLVLGFTIRVIFPLFQNLTPGRIRILSQAGALTARKN